MAKAKKVEDKQEVVVKGVPSPYAASDLSLEKRVELYSAEFEKFKTDNENQFGLKIDVELAHTAKGIFPRMVLVDLLKKENEQTKG